MDKCKLCNKEVEQLYYIVDPMRDSDGYRTCLECAAELEEAFDIKVEEIKRKSGVIE